MNKTTKELPKTLRELKPAGYNSRKISRRSFAGLKSSLEELGDIAGFTFNRRFMEESFDRELARAIRHESTVGLIMAGVLTIIMTGNQTYLTGSNQVEAQQAARVALELMAREIRGAGYSSLTVVACPPMTSCPIVGDPVPGTLTATTLVVQNDTNANGTFAATERILYTLNGNNLQRRDYAVDAAPQTIVGGIEALTFTYLDENGAPTGKPEDLRSVQISLTTQPENQPATWQTGRVTMSDQIRLRNR